MDFKDKVRYYVDNKYRNINEMALKDLKGSEKDWEDGDLEAVADKYIENALKDWDKTKHSKEQRLVNIKRGLTATFKSKKLDSKREDIDTLKGLIRSKVDELIKAEKSGKP